MVEAKSYQQMSDEGATDQQQYMMQDQQQDQYVDEYGNDVVLNPMQYSQMEQQPITPMTALVSISSAILILIMSVES